MLKLGAKCKQVHYINLPVFNMFEVFHSYLFILFYYKKFRGEFPHKHSEFGFSGRERAACSNQLEVRSVVGRHLPPEGPRLHAPCCLRPAAPSVPAACLSHQHAGLQLSFPSSQPLLTEGWGQRSRLLFCSFSLCFSPKSFFCAKNPFWSPENPGF